MPTAAISAARTMNTRNVADSSTCSSVLASTSSHTTASAGAPLRVPLGPDGDIGDRGVDLLQRDRAAVVDVERLEVGDDHAGVLARDVAHDHVAIRAGGGVREADHVADGVRGAQQLHRVVDAIPRRHDAHMEHGSEASRCLRRTPAPFKRGGRRAPRAGRRPAPTSNSRPRSAASSASAAEPNARSAHAAPRVGQARNRRRSRSSCSHGVPSSPAASEAAFPHRLLGEAVALLRLAERTGQGIDRAYRDAARWQGAAANLRRWIERTIDQIDEKVIEHVQEYGFVKNRTLQRLFDRDLYASRSAQRPSRPWAPADARHRARRSGVKYGPGPRFPKSKRPTDTRDMPDAESVPNQFPFPGRRLSTLPRRSRYSRNRYPIGARARDRDPSFNRRKPTLTAFDALTPKPRLCGAFGAVRDGASPSSSADSGGGIRTRDLRVMRPLGGVARGRIWLSRAK